MKLFRDIPGLISIPVNEEVKKLIFFHGKDKERLVEETILEKYDQYYRLAFSYVHNEADANDIVQNIIEGNTSMLPGKHSVFGGFYGTVNSTFNKIGDQLTK